MTDDLIKLLRKHVEDCVASWPYPSPIKVENHVGWKAADRMEELQARVDELEERLK